MSTELAVAIIGLIAVAIPATIEVWRRRDGSRKAVPPVTPDVQPLREEAVTALMDAFMSADELRLTSQDEASDGLATLQKEYRGLVRLRARLGIARGVSDQEVEAFTQAAEMVAELFRAVTTQTELRDSSAYYNAEEMTAIDLAREEAQVAFHRFAEVAREAAAEAPA